MHPTHKYAEDVLNGQVVACKWVQLACERHLTDLDRDSVYFDEKEANKVINFFPEYLRHSKGEWANRPFHLAPWQEFIVGSLFGWKNKETRYRRFRIAYEEVARKNGKTTMIAGIGNFLFLADKEPGAEVYTAATKKDQAALSHSESVRMVKKSPKLRNRVGIYRNNMSIDSTASKYQPLGADADTVDGLNIHGGLIDELHAHKTRDMWDVLETATGSRRQPLQMAITTAGVDQTGICYEQHEYVQQILKRTIEDDSYFGIIYTLDLNKDCPNIKKEDEDDWTNEEVWIKANPNLGFSAKLDDLQRKAKKAKIIPAAQNNFLRKHMDVWTQQVDRWIDLDLWDQNNAGGIYVYQ